MEYENTTQTQITNIPNNNYINNYTPIQLRLPLIFDELIKFDDPVYSFNQVMEGVDLQKYLKKEKKDNRGRKGYNPVTLLKVILFAFQIRGYASTREIADLCYNDIRFRWLLQYEERFPSHMTIDNFMNEYLLDTIDNIFVEINNYIFSKTNVDMEHTYIDGTKIEANANKYSWVWKKACISFRNKLFVKITKLLESMNEECKLSGYVYTIMDVYPIDYMEKVYINFMNTHTVNKENFVYGQGTRKSFTQKTYELLNEYIAKLKEYAYKIDKCGGNRNSYSKTDNDATFMRIKRDYMGNDQLLPAYNIQLSVNDEFISVYDVEQFASDTDCFVPLMEKYAKYYDKYPKYPVADAGYGSYNNYLYCEEKGMEKYMKFAMYKKTVEDKKYRDNIFRAVNFKTDNEGNLICPNNKKFIFQGTRAVKGNKYGRTEEIYTCEDCSNCPLKDKCTKSKTNRTININRELTSFHQEVINNLESIHGALLRVNRSIQSEGAFGIIKQDKFYRRIVRKGLDKVNLEIGMISIGYNIYKYHNKRNRNIL